MRECDGCEQVMVKGERRFRCKACGKLVCGWCWNHVHERHSKEMEEQAKPVGKSIEDTAKLLIDKYVTPERERAKQIEAVARDAIATLRQQGYGLDADALTKVLDVAAKPVRL